MKFDHIRSECLYIRKKVMLHFFSRTMDFLLPLIPYESNQKKIKRNIQIDRQTLFGLCIRKSYTEYMKNYHFFSLFLCEETVRTQVICTATIFETVQWDNIIEPLMILCRSNYPHICYYSRWSRSAFVYTYIAHKARNEYENIFEHMQKDFFFFF